jgi:hypothetical protein
MEKRCTSTEPASHWFALARPWFRCASGTERITLLRHPFAQIERDLANRPSQRVAEQVISDMPVPVTDQVSGLPAFRYVRKVEPRTSGL